MLSKTYQDSTAVSQSMLKDFEKLSLQQFYYKWIVKEPTEDDDKFLFGSLVDLLAFESEDFHNHFAIADCAMPSLQIKQIVSRVFSDRKKSNGLDTPLGYCAKEILWFAKQVGYGTNYKDTTILDRVITAGNDYFEFLKKTDGKKAVTQEEFNDAMACVHALQTSKHSYPYFSKEQEGIELMYQVEISINHYFTADTMDYIPLKACIDILRIDHNKKTIQVSDLKTTYSTKGFEKSIKEFGYGYQLSFYTFLVKEWIKTFRDGGMKDYEVIQPVNVVLERWNRSPHIFEYAMRDINVLRTGDFVRGIKGWNETLEELHWHIANDEWFYLKTMVTKGKIQVVL